MQALFPLYRVKIWLRRFVQGGIFRGVAPTPNAGNSRRVIVGGQPFGERAKSWTTLTAHAAQLALLPSLGISRFARNAQQSGKNGGLPPLPYGFSPIPFSPLPSPPSPRFSVVRDLRFTLRGEIVITFSHSVAVFTYTKQLLRTVAAEAY